MRAVLTIAITGDIVFHAIHHFNDDPALRGGVTKQRQRLDAGGHEQIGGYRHENKSLYDFFLQDMIHSFKVFS